MYVKNVIQLVKPARQIIILVALVSMMDNL